MSKAARAGLCFVALVAFALPCLGRDRVRKGDVEGYVRDESGTPLQGVGVMAAGAYVSEDHTVVAAFIWNGNYSMHDHRLSVHTTKTDSSGHYSMKGLVPGAYAFYGTGRSPWDKYETHTQGNIVIVAGQKTQFDVVAHAKSSQELLKAGTNAQLGDAPAAEDQNAKPISTQPIAPSSPDKTEDDLFMRVRTDELKLSTAARKYFDQGNYKAAIRFYSQARQIETSKVWQVDYPFLAGSYFFLNDEADFRETLNEMMSKVTSRRAGFLGFKTPLGFLLQNLGALRSKLPEDQWPLIDHYIDAVQAERNHRPE